MIADSHRCGSLSVRASGLQNRTIRPGPSGRPVARVLVRACVRSASGHASGVCPGCVRPSGPSIEGAGTGRTDATHQTRCQTITKGSVVPANPPSSIAALRTHLTALLGPAVTGASCRGRAPLFDLDLPFEPAEQREQRHAMALALCRGCPARAACAAALASSPPAVTGVWAGQVVGRPGRPPRSGRRTS